MRSAITFDFHNTLASCNSWFALEVHTLPARTAEWLMERGVTHGAPVDPELVTETYRALRQEIVAHGRELPATEGIVETFLRLGIEVAPDDVMRAVDALMQEARDDVAPMPGAVETVRRLALDGFTLGIVSSAVYPPFLDWTLDAFGIRDAFASVVTSAGAGYYKSRPEIYQVAVDALGAAPAETVHVGDSFRFDHLAARSAGLRTVWVAAGGVEAPEDGPPPHLRLESLVDAADPIAHLAARPL